jgi:hypothetical protein
MVNTGSLMNIVILIPLLLLCVPVLAQDTTQSIPPRPGFVERDTVYRGLIHFGVGTQRSFYAELGISRMRLTIGPSNGGFVTRFASLEYTPHFNSGSPDIFGLKAGWHNYGVFGAWGIEGKYLTDLGIGDVVITPRLGLGLGFINLLYGYNISFYGRPFSRIGKHNVSLSFNFSRKMIREAKGK